MHQDSILFSIIIPTYNRADMIVKAIQSVIEQTYSNWELIIVDDGSTDNTEEVVRSYNDERIKYFYKDHEERSIARNYGIDKSTGLYISFLDDDDYYLPDFLSEFNKKIEKEKRAVGYFMCQEFVENNSRKKINYISEKLLNNPTRLIWNIQPSIRPFVIHKQIFTNCKFNIDCKYGQDHELITRISLKYQFFYIPIPLTVNYEHSNQGTKTKFGNEYRENALLSIYCMQNLVKNNTELIKLIPSSELYQINNHLIYGFCSASMKHFDFNYFNFLFKKFDIRGNKLKLSFYIISLILRIPIFYIKSKLS
ncbi:MAG: glycosyltransferase family 2 protein [Saprospiraceae bacterium]